MSLITVNRGDKGIVIKGTCGSQWAGTCKVVQVSDDEIVLDCDTELVDECPTMETERLIDDVIHEGKAEASSIEIAEGVVEAFKREGINVTRSGKTITPSGDVRPGGKSSIVIGNVQIRPGGPGRGMKEIGS